MPRLMSVAFTEDAVRERRKTVTRRKGWLMLKPGDRLTLCRKVMGRKKGEPLVRIVDVVVVSVRRERLGDITDDEVALEGFPDMGRVDFLNRYFALAQDIYPHEEITRIEWRYLDPICQARTSCVQPAQPEHNPCCSSHGRPMCCEHYCHTHFIEVNPCTPDHHTAVR